MNPCEGGTKVCINGPGHMTKMVTMPIYGKTLKFFSRTGSLMILKLEDLSSTKFVSMVTLG